MVSVLSWTPVHAHGSLGMIERAENVRLSGRKARDRNRIRLSENAGKMWGETHGPHEPRNKSFNAQ